jgi:hypothetical protein
VSKFFSYPGSKPPETEAKRDRFATPEELRADPRYSEYFQHRSATSHRFSGLDVESDPRKGNILFNGEPARVVHEEHDQHSGETHTIIARSQQGSSGTQRITWKPDDARRIVATDVRSTTD